MIQAKPDVPLEPSLGTRILSITLGFGLMLPELPWLRPMVGLFLFWVWMNWDGKTAVSHTRQHAFVLASYFCIAIVLINLLAPTADYTASMRPKPMYEIQILLCWAWCMWRSLVDDGNIERGSSEMDPKIKTSR